MQRQPLALALVVLSACAATAGGGAPATASAQAAPAGDAQGVDSRELKLLLRGDRFGDPAAAFAEYWALVQKAAAAQGVGVRPRYRAFDEKRRAVTFYDTADFALRGRGYALRVRRRLREGRPEGKTEYALKLRSADLAVAASAPVRAPDHRDEVELEEDVVSDPTAPGGVRRIYARRSKFKIRTRSAPAPTVAGFATLFPVLATLGLAPDAPLLPVGGTIDERRVSPGKLDFGQRVVATVDLTLWQDSAGRPLVGELSFDHRVRDPASPPQPATDRVFAFLVALRAASAGWVAEGTTKTAFTYGRARAAQPRETP